MEWFQKGMQRNINAEIRSRGYKSISDPNVDSRIISITEDATSNTKIRVKSTFTLGILERNTISLGFVNCVRSSSSMKKNNNFMKMLLDIPFSKIQSRFYKLCSLVSLRWYTKALSTHLRSSIVEKSRQKPQDLATNKYSTYALLRAAGVSISSSFTEIGGHVLLALKLGEMVKKLELDLTEANLELKDEQKLHADCVSKVKSIEKTVKEHANNREDRLKELDKKIKTTRAQMQSASKDLKVNSVKNAHHETGSDYHLLATDPHKARDKLEKLQSVQSDLEKRVNKKLIAMFEKAEGEYNELLSKKIVIENGNDIRNVIDIRHVKVDSEFGSILLILLPGTMAKLEPPEGCSFFDGLEVRVAFGSVWKLSLPELSGGQRSLLVLSLIVALILFKLAPLYILVEVDAAVELSATQHWKDD